MNKTKNIIQHIYLLYIYNMANTAKNNASSKNATVKSSGLTNEEKMAIYNEIAAEKKEQELKAAELAKQNAERIREIKKQIKEVSLQIRELQKTKKELVMQWNEAYDPIRQLRNS